MMDPSADQPLKPLARRQVVAAILGTLIFGVVVIFALRQAENHLQHTTDLSLPTMDHQQAPITIGAQKFQVEVVNTSQSMQKGLGDRDQIGSDGMLFVLSERQRMPFWMKDMQFDLDFVWIDDGKIVDLTENVLAPRSAAENQDKVLKIYQPIQAVQAILEVPAGTIKKDQLQKGMAVRF